MTRSRTPRRRLELTRLEDRINPFAVASISPANQSIVLLPLTSVEVNFDAPYNPSTVQTFDLIVDRGTVSGVTLVDPDTVRFDIAGIPQTDAVMNLQITAGSIRASGGQSILGFNGRYLLDSPADPSPFPGPLAARLPDVSDPL